MARKNSEYSREEYWDERFVKEESYDWLVEYESNEAFRHLVHENISRDAQILMLGCGNSCLSESMYQDGYCNITNIDFSSVCIEKMKEKHNHCPGMTWDTMDIRDLRFPDNSFDVVLEKGTLDAVLCTEKDPWRLSDDGFETMEVTLSHISRVLKPNGRFISITFASPAIRRPIYAREKYNWSIEETTLGEFFHHFFFVMDKSKTMSAKDIELEKTTQAKRLDTGEKHFGSIPYDDDPGYLNNIDIS